jgi:hypothetical protein
MIQNAAFSSGNLTSVIVHMSIAPMITPFQTTGMSAASRIRSQLFAPLPFRPSIWMHRQAPSVASEPNSTSHIPAALMMFANQANFFGMDFLLYIKYVHNNWIIILLVAAILQLYTSHRIANELEKESQ